jgi:hypothetical protein
MPLVQRRHNMVRSMLSHVVTVIKNDDEFGKDNQLIGNITAIEHRIGHAIDRTSRLITADAVPAGN